MELAVKLKEARTIGAIIKARREKVGLNKTELAEKSGLTPSAITYYENGSRKPNIPSMAKLCKALGMSMDEIMGNTNIGMSSVSNVVSALNSVDWEKRVSVEVNKSLPRKSYKIVGIVEKGDSVVIQIERGC